MIKVDMDREVVLCPVNGQPVPFAIHTIKNVVQPEPDNHAHYLRINFFAPGQALGKEASRRMARLIDRYVVYCNVLLVYSTTSIQHVCIYSMFVHSVMYY
jgi:nucleosome binding factor SPN SPT16 subunit